MDAKNAEVVLDRTGLIQLVGGILSLLVLGFSAGAVVGFWIHGGMVEEGVPSSAMRTDTVVVRQAATEVCVPAELPAAPSMADLGMPSLDAPDEDEEGALELLEDPLGIRAEGVRDPGVASPPAPRYAVQVGVFGVEANADRMADRLRGQGYDPLVVAWRNRSGQWMTRVHLAVYSSETSAVAEAKSFTDREGLPAVVVTLQEDEE